MSTLPEWRRDHDAYPEWLREALTEKQLDLPHNFKWQLCVRMLDVTTSVHHVALELATYMNPKAACRPSAVRMARETSRNRVTVRAALRELKNRGWLHIEERPGKEYRYQGVFPPHVEVIRDCDDGSIVALRERPPPF